MKYIGISVTPEPKITGIKEGTPSLDLQSATVDLLQDWAKHEFAYPADGVSFPRFALENGETLNADLPAKAKQMDFMFFSPFLLPTEFIISHKAANFLSRHHLLTYELVPVTLNQHRNILPGPWYFWINHKIMPEILDFRQSVMTTEVRHKVYTQIQFQNIVEYSAHSQLYPLGSRLTTIKLQNPIPPPDCFGMKIEGVFMSQACWEDYERSGLIGLRKNKWEIEWLE